jgi:signal transduction histidine kinase
MVNNIVEHSKFEHSSQQLFLKEQNLTQCCREVIQVFQYRLQMEKFKLKENLEENVVCLFDWQAMTQVLYNLIDNAIKYSGEKKIIEIELKSTKRKIYLLVSDHGIGIPKEKREQIFQEYYRVDDDHVFAQRGTGIGLALVQKMVSSNGGRIQVSDHYPEGTCFKLSFPNPQHQSL